MDHPVLARPDETRLHQLIEQVCSGDDKARTELIGLTYERLRCLARTMLHHDFQRLTDQHNLTSIVDESVLRLLNALKVVQPPTVGDYFRFAAALIRRVLLDLARRRSRQMAEVIADAVDTSPGPMQLAMWAEFHEAVNQLAESERTVFDLHFYQGLSQATVAQIVGLHPKQVSRLWLQAVRQLPFAPN